MPRLKPSQKIARHMVHLQPEKILDLGAGNHHGNPVGKSHYYRTGNVFHRAAQPGHTQKNQEDTGYPGAHKKAVNTVFRYNAGHHNHKCAGRSANLHA